MEGPKDDLKHRPDCPRCHTEFSLDDWFYDSLHLRNWECHRCKLIMTEHEMRDPQYEPPDNGRVLGIYPDNAEDN